MPIRDIDLSTYLFFRGFSTVQKAGELSSEYPRSPLRYPGGKSKAVKAIVSCIPQDVKRLCSPFLGGASVELACTSLGIEVHGYDRFEPLVDFWHEILGNPEGLAAEAEKYLPLSKEKFSTLQRSHMASEDRQERAVVFYVLNRSSFSGTTLSGGMSPGHARFTQSAISRVRGFRAENLRIQHGDFRDTLERHPRDFLYLDPPYANRWPIYGKRGDLHKDFDHAELADTLHQRDRWLLSYNDCPLIRKLYRNSQFIPLEWSYGINQSRKSNEVLIVSEDLAV